MFFGVYKNDADEICGGFYDYEEWYKDTFSPSTVVLENIDLTVHGKTYADRKEDVRNKAIDYQNIPALGMSLYMSEVAIFGEYFAAQGKRYGLLREFRENAII